MAWLGVVFIFSLFKLNYDFTRRALDIAIEKLRTEHESRSEAEEIKEMLREILEIVKKLENNI